MFSSWNFKEKTCCVVFEFTPCLEAHSSKEIIFYKKLCRKGFTIFMTITDKNDETHELVSQLLSPVSVITFLCYNWIESPFFLWLKNHNRNKQKETNFSISCVEIKIHKICLNKSILFKRTQEPKRETFRPLRQGFVSGGVCFFLNSR